MHLLMELLLQRIILKNYNIGFLLIKGFAWMLPNTALTSINLPAYDRHFPFQAWIRVAILSIRG